MVFYYIVFILSIVLSLFLSKKKIENGCKYIKIDSIPRMMIAMMPIAIIFLFRWGVGIDANWYKGTYPIGYMTLLNNPSATFGTDILFSIIAKIFCYLRIPYFWWTFFLAAIYISSVSLFFRKWSTNLPVSIFMFFTTDMFFMGFGALRQVLAISFLLLAYCELKNQKKITINYKIVIMFVCAVLSHSSALLAVLVFALSIIKVPKKVLIKLSVLGTVLYPVTVYLIRKIVSFSEYGIEFLGTEFAEQQGSITQIALSLVSLSLMIFFYDKLLNENPNNYFWINNIFFYYILMINSAALIQTYRIVFYFMPALIISVSLLITTVKKLTNRLAAICLVVGISVFIFWNSYYNYNAKDNYGPYMWVFSYSEFLR